MSIKDKSVSIPFSETMRTLGRALAVSLSVRGGLSAAVAAFGVAMAFVPLLAAYALAAFTDEIQALYTHRGSLSAALAAFGLLIAIFSVQTVYQFISEYLKGVDTLKTERYIHERLMDTAARVEYKYVQNEDGFLDKIELADRYGGDKVAGSMQRIFEVIYAGCTFLSLVVALMSVNVWIVAILIATCIPAVVLSYLQSDETYKESTKWTTEGRMLVHLFFVAAGANERCRAMMDVRFWGIYPWVRDMWTNMARGYTEKKNAITRKHVLYNSAADILRNIVYIGVLLFAAFEVIRDPGVGLGVFMLVFTLSGQIQQAATTLFSNAARVLGDAGFMKAFFDLLDTPKERLDDSPAALDCPDIEFRDVSFRYPGSERYVLKNVSVKLRYGEKVAIVGENGSGKSTFINLICGMFAPERGEVLVGGVPVTERLKTSRKAMGVAFQNFSKYETSIRHNITLAHPTKETTDVELLGLLERVGLSDCLVTMPDGLDEMVGSFSKSGRNLSGGQWQKLAIARVLFRDHAGIYILDEPTAALDPLAEANLYRYFSDYTGERTTILISHRLGITNVVDRVLMFHDGVLIGDGSHAELTANCPQYAEMYHAQHQWYM